ncbi:MAG: hypothetical protein M1828_000559 [Chrysothrix sp. TS-e1954]|nr:MAG: hypothetical protein M1828_000559 [Chrysothrix sp. TS-e1954]
MPTLPSTFASAAASNGNESTSRRTSSRIDGNSSSGDWSRRPNGATQTFRRSSTLTNNVGQSHQRDASASDLANPAPNTGGAYVPPHISASRSGPAIDTRYSRGELLDIYRELKDGGELDDDLGDLYVGEGAHDGLADGGPGSEMCLNGEGPLEPVAMYDMTEDEVELFASVNSPLKAPNQTNQRDGSQRDGPVPRKMSLSQGYSGNALASPVATRNTGRRREPSESFTSFSKETNASRTDQNDSGELPKPLLRRRTDMREESSEENERSFGPAPLGSLRRISTGPLSAGLGGPASPWANQPQTAGPTSMGSFGSMAFGGGSLGQEKRLPLGSRGESRFRGLMGRQSSEDISIGIRQKSSQPNLGKLEESTQSRGGSESGPTGSAALGGAHDEAPFDMSKLGELGTPSRRRFPMNRMSSFGQTQDFSRFQDIPEQSNFPQSQQPEEPMSPTFTNPYVSPEQRNLNMHDIGGESTENTNFHLPGLGGMESNIRTNQAHQYQDNRNLGQGPAHAPGSSRGLGGLPGLGGLGTFGTSQAGWQPGATATRGFPDGLREPSMMSPGGGFGSSLAGLGGVGPYGTPASVRPGGNGPIGQGGRLGSLFPNVMQDQMRVPDPSQRQVSGNRMDESQSESDESYGDDAMQARDRAVDQQGQNISYTQTRDPGQSTPGLASIGEHQQNRMLSDLAGSASAQPPAAQQKTMVMPDRIRWIYRDPQGNTQGPWTGLEMHDWYRAGFFSPELLVKKAEDPDYEPLAQLIRRIGNSREPFLVPQIGIPGPPNNQASSTWPSQAPPASVSVAAPAPAAPTAPTAPAAQPPFASSFPSFGTTLTAEQQNALERRKQEEQYLMARQKEHLAQQQVMVKQMQMQTNHGLLPQQLQHHSSAQSLHSQPSHGSIASPSAAFAASPMGQASHLAPGAPSSFDNHYRAGAMGTGQLGGGADLANIAEEDVASIFQRMNVGRAGHAQTGDSINMGDLKETRGNDNHRAAAAFADRMRLQQEQQAYQQDQRGSPILDHERQRQFHELQNNRDDRYSQQQQQFEAFDEDDEAIHEEPSLTEQVQKAASAKRPQHVSGPSAWVKPDVIESRPPQQTSSPLPAPAARRGGQNLADTLVAESSQSPSPAVETPGASLAPWAKEVAESQKQPSLKEIQQAEALRAAKQEAAAAAERRAALEYELTNQAPAPAPGLPTTSTWGKGEPADGTSSAWAKSAIPSKATTVQSTAASKKTLQQIQKEEEARKHRAAVAAAAVAPSNPIAQANAAGKRYADLAGKVSAPSPTSTSGSNAWTTVGAGGKTRAPATPATPVLSKTAIGSTTAVAAAASKPKTTAVPSRTSASAVNALEDFKKWAIGELRPDLAKGIQVDEFVNNLITNYPADTEIILDAVHQHSRTLDSRHFAEEFVRRKGLAEKGKPQPSLNASSPAGQANESKGGGWSEVARKNPAAAPKDDNSAFKIVAAKKKSGRR